MNREALHRALREAGVAADCYRIEGVHEPAPTPVDHLFLRRRAGMWETGVYERGTYEVLARTDSETEACQHLYGLACGTS